MPATAQDLFPYFRAMADRKRLHIVQYLAQHGEASVTELGQELRLSQPLVSWHLSLLRKTGIVCTRRKGRSVYCSIDTGAVEGYAGSALQLFGLTSPERRVESDADPAALERASGTH